jgi:hypothetical protein
MSPLAFEPSVETLAGFAVVAARKAGADSIDAEEAVSAAVVDLLEKEGEWDTGAVVQRATWKLLSARQRRESQNISLDAFRDGGEDHSPIEFATHEVDFEAHLALRGARDNPILGARLEDLEAGGAGTLRRLGWSKDLIVRAIIAFMREEGRRPTEREAQSDPRLPRIECVREHFGRWSKALEAAGVTGIDFKWTPESAVEAAREWCQDHGRAPSYRQAQRRGGPLPWPRTVERLFGSWTRFLEIAFPERVAP